MIPTHLRFPETFYADRWVIHSPHLMVFVVFQDCLGHIRNSPKKSKFPSRSKEICVNLYREYVGVLHPSYCIKYSLCRDDADTGLTHVVKESDVELLFRQCNLNVILRNEILGLKMTCLPPTGKRVPNHPHLPSTFVVLMWSWLVIFLAHLVYQPKSLMQSWFVRRCWHWRRWCHWHHLCTPPPVTGLDRNFIFGTHLHICPPCMHIKYLVILTCDFSMAAILVLFFDMLSCLHRQSWRLHIAYTHYLFFTFIHKRNNATVIFFLKFMSIFLNH